MPKKHTLAIIAILFLGCLLVPQQSDALTVTPAIREITLTPGEEKTDQIELENDGLEALELTAEVVNFTAKNQTGEPNYLDTAPTGAATWTTVAENTVNLAAGETAELLVTFNPPTAVEAGGHYIGVVFSFGESTVSADENQVVIETKVGVPFLATVTGSYTQDGEIVSFGTADSSTTYTKGSVTFSSIDFKNTGDVHLKPTGTIEITNMFGKTVETIDVNTDLAAVLPDSTRTFTTGSWADVGNGFGQYTAKLTLSAGTVTSSASINFFVFSTMGIVIVVVILIVLIALLIAVTRKKGNQPTEKQTPEQSEQAK